MSEDPGYVEVRRDCFGPFVKVRWGQVGFTVRELPWMAFLLAVRLGGFQTERLAGRPGWVRVEIDEGFGEHDRPSGWRPKVLELPDQVWSRFVEAAGNDVYSGLEPGLWVGNPAAGGRRWRVTSATGDRSVWERMDGDGVDGAAASGPPDQGLPLPGEPPTEGRSGQGC